MAQKNTKPSGSRVVALSIVLGILVLIAVALVLSSVGVLNIQFQKSEQSVITPPGSAIKSGPTPTPTPTELLQGKETYTIGQWSGAQGPSMSTITINPHDPKVQDKQTFVVHISYDQPVTAASIELVSDHKTRIIPLTLNGGTNMNGDWQAQWTVDDTVLYKYILNMSATGGGVTNTVTVAPRS
jgi:hypothetical protein